MASFLTPTDRYAAGGLLGLALHQAQIHQTHPLGSTSGEKEAERHSSGSCRDSVSEDPELWVNNNSGLLRPVFRILNIESNAWSGLEETAGSTPAKHHIGAFLRILSEENDDTSPHMKDQELALSKSVDAMAASMEPTTSIQSKVVERHREYENDCRQKFGIGPEPSADVVPDPLKGNDGTMCKMVRTVQADSDRSSLEETRMLSHQKKVTVLYELLSACLAGSVEDNKHKTKRAKGYDARHRVALRLLSTWFNIKWITMEAIETMVALSAMALSNEKTKDEDHLTPRSSWGKWKRGGIIGAAALTGGTLMAITGGLAAPAIAAGLGALAPTLGTIIPVIGASGFAAAASAAGTVAGSIAVAASFGAAGAGLTGTKMAKRTGGIDEFMFKGVGDNHGQGRLAVEILISGFVFEEDDFVRPWEGHYTNQESYVLQWESENLIAVSTAIQDWLTSRVAMELMKQGAMMTVLSTLLAALAWPATLLVAADFIDSKWAIALDRSDKAGRLLAEVLLKGLQGQRPVTLIGFSLGARVIFKCLQVLSENDHSASLVEKVVLLGAPISIKDENWESARKIVAGRFVNAYSTNDWMLGLAFRASLLTQGLAGIQPIEVPGIENVNVTEVIEGHSSYLWDTQRILEQLELDAYYPVTGTLIKP